MGKIPKGASRENPSEGSHLARCIQVIDLGTQPSSSEEYEDRRMVQLGFEILDEETTEGKAMTVFRQFGYTSSARGHLSKSLKAWLNVKDFNEFDMDQCLDAPALITIEVKQATNGNEYANITSIVAPPKGQKVKRSTEPTKSLYLDEDFDQEVFDSLPEFMQEKIAKSPEYMEVTQGSNKKKAKPVNKKPAPNKAKRR